jgi:fructose-1,6-bisphosphatase II
MQDSHRNLGLDLVRATEAAALVAGQWMGMGVTDRAEIEAAEAMCATLDTIEMNGTIVIGQEGRKPTCPLTHTGAPLGTGAGLPVDVVMDPIDGQYLLAQGYPGALAVIAVAPRGAFWGPAPAVYMEKLVVDAEVAPFLVPECLGAPAAWTLGLVARAKGKKVSDLVVFCLDRPRHADLIAEIRSAGARVTLRDEGDIAGALLAVFEEGGVDILLGTGGIAEGLIAACAVKAASGAMLGCLDPQSAAESTAIREAGLDVHRILTVDELVAGDEVFFAATGITDGPLLDGVRYHGERASSNSLILRGETHTRRIIQAQHLLGE